MQQTQASFRTDTGSTRRGRDHRAPTATAPSEAEISVRFAQGDQIGAAEDIADALRVHAGSVSKEFCQQLFPVFVARHHRTFSRAERETLRVAVDLIAKRLAAVCTPEEQVAIGGLALKHGFTGTYDKYFRGKL